MIGLIKVRENGATPGNILRDTQGRFIGRTGGASALGSSEWRRASKSAWRQTGELFHRDFMPKRFTHEGARLLGYIRRKGELMKGTKQYWRSYTGRKEKKFGHTLPLVFTGESRQLARARDVRSTSNGVKIVLNARKLNFRHPKSQIRMNEEVRRVAPVEAEEIAKHHDRHLGDEIFMIRTSKSTEI